MLGVLSAPVWLTGCYTYVPTAGGMSSTGSGVEVELSDQGRALLNPLLGDAVLLIDGTLIADRDSVLVLEVTRTVHLRGAVAFWNGEAVSIPRGGIHTLRSRQLATGRTTALVAGVTGALVAVTPFLKVIGGGSGRPSSEPCPESCTAVR